jgi:glycosyltransferase involved in cell wall biosynthesis
LLSRIRRKPLLLEIRDLWPEFAIDIGVLKNPVLIRMSRWLERFLYNSATHLLVNSPAYRDYLINKGVPQLKVTLIPNGVDPMMFRPEANGGEFRKRWNCDGKFVVMYAGALGLANDIPTILRAASRLKDQPQIRFVLMGDGKERGNLERVTHELQLNNVTFVDSIPRAKMPNALASSDVCIATLKKIEMFKTTYPNKVFDYMAAGRPIILAIDGVIRQVVEAAKGGVFVPPGNDRALARAVERLYHNRSEAQAMGAAGRSYVTRHFNRQCQSQVFGELIESIEKRYYGKC